MFPDIEHVAERNYRNLGSGLWRWWLNNFSPIQHRGPVSLLSSRYLWPHDLFQVSCWSQINRWIWHKKPSNPVLTGMGPSRTSARMAITWVALTGSVYNIIIYEFHFCRFGRGWDGSGGKLTLKLALSEVVLALLTIGTKRNAAFRTLHPVGRRELLDGDQTQIVDLLTFECRCIMRWLGEWSEILSSALGDHALWWFPPWIRTGHRHFLSMASHNQGYGYTCECLLQCVYSIKVSDTIASGSNSTLHSRMSWHLQRQLGHWALLHLLQVLVPHQMYQTWQTSDHTNLIRHPNLPVITAS